MSWYPQVTSEWDFNEYEGGSWSNTIAGLILGLHPTNERCRYNLTPSLIGWAQTYNQPWIGYVTLVAITGTTILGSYLGVKWLQLIWRLGTSIFHLPDVQMNCRDLTSWQGAGMIAPAMTTESHDQLKSWFLKWQWHYQGLKELITGNYVPAMPHYLGYRALR